MPDDGDKRSDQPDWVFRALFALATLLASAFWGSLAWAGLRALT